jgi:DNA-binding SARP family transcriptional activator
LLQILLHHHEQGVERHRLQELLFEDSNSDDVHHLLRSVIYNTKKRLKSEGLPDTNYIVFRDGAYYWTDEIPVYEDAEEFERLCREAATETDSDARLDKSLQACRIYTGEFLPQQTSLVWVAREDRRYKIMFKNIVDLTADELRARRRYTEMEELGRHASMNCPLNDMEALTMEALTSMGRYRDAQKYYDETANYYQKELGVNASFAVMSKLEEIADRFVQPRNMPQMITRQLFEEEEDTSMGGYFCTYPVFKGISRMVKRNKNRTDGTYYLMICTLNEAAPGKIKDDKTMDKIYARMEKALGSSVRKGDAICRYGKGQYIILLMNIDRISCDVVRDRINTKFGLRYKGCTIDYHVEPL